MSLIERIKIQLTNEMLDIDEFLKNVDDNTPGNKLMTHEVVIRYKLNGTDKFLILDIGEIFKLLKNKTTTIRKEST